jgi:hypothetical protein
MPDPRDRPIRDSRDARGRTPGDVHRDRDPGHVLHVPGWGLVWLLPAAYVALRVLRLAKRTKIPMATLHGFILRSVL